MDMGEQVYSVVDEDIYDEITEIHNETGRKKSKIINERLRIAFQNEEPTLEDSIIPVFGQSLFIAGFVVAMFAAFGLGIGVSMVGLAMMVGAKVDEYREKHDTSSVEALVKVLGA